jgi:hypothetical protein
MNNAINFFSEKKYYRLSLLYKWGSLLFIKCINYNYLTIRFLVIFSLGGCSEAQVKQNDNERQLPPGPVPKGVTVVSIRKAANGYQLLRGGQPYLIKGGAGVQQFAQLRAAGGNSVRLWTTDYAGPLLDEAQHQGLTVMMGLWLQHEDSQFSYYDPGNVKDQLEQLRQQVLRYRYHPSLLMWNIGNEIELYASGPRLYEAINDIAHMVHELDPNHPVTISMGDFVDNAAQLQREAPEVDILSINIYGALRTLPTLLKKSGWQGPYIVTEYGGEGYWEADSTKWNVPIEQTSAQKAQFVKDRYPIMQADSAHFMGSYAFYWGSKFESTSTWFSLFEPTGEKTELVDELHLLWRHHYPDNRAPHLTEMRLAGQTAHANIRLRAGQQYTALVEVTDPEGDSLTTRWDVFPEVGFAKVPTDKERTTSVDALPECVIQVRGKQAIIRMPTRPGPYRVCVRVFDGHGSVATANVPVLVQRKSRSAAYTATTSD